MTQDYLDELADKLQALIDEVKSKGLIFWKCCDAHIFIEDGDLMSKDVHW